MEYRRVRTGASSGDISKPETALSKYHRREGMGRDNYITKPGLRQTLWSG